MPLRLSRIALILIILGSLFYLPVAKAGQPDAAQLQLALKKLNVVGNVLFIAAHPDDENSAVLASLSLGRGVRTAYLSLTRGDGGQNLLGPEQGDLLGVIRTQELLAARQYDGAEQFFTRAIDFGYSKSAEETLKMWGKDDVLSDIVWVIRRYQPDVIISQFQQGSGGHGHHIAAGDLAAEAFQISGDSSRFPEQLKFVKPWKAKRLIYSRYNFGGQSPSASERDKLASLPVGSYVPLLGKSFNEIASLGRSMHKSQGMGNAQTRGERTNYFQLASGEPMQSDIFDGIDLSWNRIPGGAAAGALLNEAYQTYKPAQPEASIPLLIKALHILQALPEDTWVAQKKHELLDAIQACAGLWLEALAGESSAIPGRNVKIATQALNRSNYPLSLISVEILPTQTVQQVNTALSNNQPLRQEWTVPIPAGMPYTQPYWLVEKKGKALFNAAKQTEIGSAELDPPFKARFVFSEGLTFDVPVLYRWVDRVAGERYRTFTIAPEVSVYLKDQVLVFDDGGPKKAVVTVISGAPQVSGRLRLEMPSGWNATPEYVPLAFEKLGQTISATFQISPGPGARGGTISAVAEIGGKKISSGVITIDYSHIWPQVVLQPAEASLLRIDLKKAGQNIGYIMGPGDEMPQALQQMGYTVTLLTDEQLEAVDFSRYDAIVTGVRAYNTRAALRDARARLLEYVNKGGALIVQYNTVQGFDSGGLGPYPIRFSNNRVTVEEAPVTFIVPEHPLLNFPNKITAEDFKDWVQERGLNFADQWDPHYQTVISCNDPGEPAQAGGLLYTRYGKGVFIFTAYAWFRQLPAGVPGSYRIFANLVSAGARHE